jgi:hypothetical protein
MKKISLVFLNVFFVIIFSSLAQSGRTAERVTMSFEYGASSDSNGNVSISFLPETNGIEGDGYVIAYHDNNPYISLYFLPEGNPLILPNDKYYRFMIGRAYKTKKGMVVGHYQKVHVNLGQKEIIVDLNLKKLDEIYSYIDVVNIVSNYPEKNLHIFPFQFPDYIKDKIPNFYDWVEVQLRGFGKEKMTTKYYKLNGSVGGYVRLPRNEGLDNQYCKAYPVIVDLENNREIIENSAPRIEFRSKPYPQQ